MKATKDQDQEAEVEVEEVVAEEGFLFKPKEKVTLLLNQKSMK